MKIKLLLALTALLVVSGSVAAYPNNYALYVSTTINSNYTETKIGTITGMMLPPVPNMGSIDHYPTLVVLLNGTGFNQEGPGWCTTCNMDYQEGAYDLDATAICSSFWGLAEPCPLDESMSITCPIIGEFISDVGPGAGPSGLEQIDAITMSKTGGLAPSPPAPAGTYYVSDWCTPATTPPDASPTLVNWPTFSPFFKSQTYCERPRGAAKGTKWNCSPFSSPPFPYTSASTPKYNCTNIDNGYDGEPFP